MRLDKLPEDVLTQIVDLGDLSVDDIINLTYLNKQHRSALASEYLWAHLHYKYWGRTAEVYDLQHGTTDSFYRRSMIHYAYHTSIMNQLAHYDGSATKFTRFFDLFLDRKYLPALVYIQHRLQKQVDSAIENCTPYIDISRLSLISSIHLAIRYDMAFKYLLKDYKNDPNVSFISILTHYSMFHRHFFKNIKYRDQKLKKIRKNLHKNIVINQLNYKNNIDFHFSKSKIKFFSSNAFIRFIRIIVKVITQSLESQPLDKRYVGDIYLENFDLASVYSGIVRGAPILIMSIVKQELEVFLKHFELFDKFDNSIELTISLTKNYMKINNFYISFIPTEILPSHIDENSYDIKSHSKLGIAKYLKETFQYSDAEVIMSLRDVDYPKLIHDLLIITYPLPKRTCTKTIESDYKFIRTVFKIVDHLTKGHITDYDQCIDLVNDFRAKDKLVHYKTFQSLLNQEQVYRFEQAFFHESSIMNCTLKEVTQRFNSRPIWLPEDDERFPLGSIVKSVRITALSMVIKQEPHMGFEAGCGYLSVFNMNDCKATFRSTSVEPLGDLKERQANIKKYYKNCNLELIGVFYAKGIDMENGKFVFFDPVN